MKKLFSILLVLVILTGCTAKPEVVSETTANETTTLTTSEVTTAESTITESITTEVTEEIEKIDVDLFDFRTDTQEYMSGLLEQELFCKYISDKSNSMMTFVYVIDLNSDNSPEVIINYMPSSFLETHYCLVFSKSSNGVFLVENKAERNEDINGIYSGSAPQAYTDSDGKTVFISDILTGGPGTGEFGRQRVYFDGKTLTTKPLMIYNWADPNDIESEQYSYFGSEFSAYSDEENKKYTEYMDSLEENYCIYDSYCKIDENAVTNCTKVATLLNGYFKLYSEDRFSGYSLQTQKYMNALLSDNHFMKMINETAGIQVLDINNDGIPETLLNMTFCGKEVFTLDNEGNSKYIKPNKDDVTYDNINSFQGDFLESYIENGKTIFITETYNGGSCGGGGGKIKVAFDGVKFNCEFINEYEYSKDNFDYIYEYTYDGEKVTEEEYNSKFDEYIKSLEKSNMFSEINENVDYRNDYTENFYQLADTIDRYYYTKSLIKPESEYVPVSEGNKFIDFEFIEDYKGGEVSDEIKKTAINCLMESDYYKESNSDKESLRKEKDKEIYSAYKKNYDFERFYDKSGNIAPLVSKAFPEDYDGDGIEEAFVLVDIPQYYEKKHFDDAHPILRNYLIYVSPTKNGEYSAEILDSFTNIDNMIMLDYGALKQLIIGGDGIMGADDHEVIYGVVDGKVKELYGFRGGFVKTGCLLGSYGWQSGGCTMYYDTIRNEYVGIAGEMLNWDNIKAMDSTGILKKYWQDKKCFIEIIGQKYYCVFGGPIDFGEIYTYENGKFKLFDEDQSTAIRHSADGECIDININKAFAEMLTPEEASKAASN